MVDLFNPIKDRYDFQDIPEEKNPCVVEVTDTLEFNFVFVKRSWSINQSNHSRNCFHIKCRLKTKNVTKKCVTSHR